jgi:predicted transcriptional regulator
VKRTPRSALVNEAGRLYVMREQLAGLKAERDQLEQRIRQLERKIADAETAFDSTFERLVDLGRTKTGFAANDETPVMTGKLPHRVLSLMKRDPSRLYTAAELSADLSIRDVQQVRTALARLVRKGLVRRSRSKGEFTI